MIDGFDECWFGMIDDAFRLAIRDAIAKVGFFCRDILSPFAWLNFGKFFPKFDIGPLPHVDSPDIVRWLSR